MALTFAQLDNTPIGPLSFVAGDRGLIGVGFTHLPAFKNGINLSEAGPSLDGLLTLESLLAEVNAYFEGRQHAFSVPIDWEELAGFQLEVLRFVTEIPYGQVLTYSEVAEQLGRPGSARAVGRALSTNPIPLVIPCHRVIGADRGLRGFIAGLETKAFLLELEGHQIVGDRVLPG